MTNYDELAARTLSPAFDASAFSTHQEGLMELFQTGTDVGALADVLKRAYFYNSKSDAWTHTVPLDFLHAVLGLVSEAGEMLEALEMGITNGQLDLTNIKEELGDFEWYLALARRSLGFTQEEIQEANINKLKERYPEKFNDTLAHRRDLIKERQALQREVVVTNSTYYQEARMKVLGLTDSEYADFQQLMRMGRGGWPVAVKAHVKDWNARNPGAPNDELALASYLWKLRKYPKP